MPKSDWDYFNCSEKYEIEYVSNLYPGNEKKVKDFLIKNCNNGTIKNFTHSQVYDLIEKKLGLKRK